MLFRCQQEVHCCFQPSHASFYSDSDSSDEIMPCSQSSREHWVRRFFFAVGPISTLGLVGDSGRTVRSLSAASKPRITQRTTRNTPSIQVEGAEHIFFSFLSLFFFVFQLFSSFFNVSFFNSSSFSFLLFLFFSLILVLFLFRLFVFSFFFTIRFQKKTDPLLRHHSRISRHASTSVLTMFIFSSASPLSMADVGEAVSER